MVVHNNNYEQSKGFTDYFQLQCDNSNSNPITSSCNKDKNNSNNFRLNFTEKTFLLILFYIMLKKFTFIKSRNLSSAYKHFTIYLERLSKI